MARQKRRKKSDIPKNSVSLAGEFAVLSQLALRGFDANMTLGHTKGVDILVSDPKTGRMLKLEVKTNYRSTRSRGSHSRLFGHTIAWIMHEKHEQMTDKDLFYCFVNIQEDGDAFRFFIVPSRIVASYVRRQHELWKREKMAEKEVPMRQFRIGLDTRGYRITTPLAKRYEDNWKFTS